MRCTAWVHDAHDPHAPAIIIAQHVNLTRAQIMQMRPDRGTPRMRIEAYMAGPAQVFRVSAAGFCTLVDVMSQRPRDHQFAVVEVPDKTYMLIDLHDTETTANMDTLRLGRHKVFQAPELAIAAVSLGW